MKQVISFFKKEAVLCISGILAVISAFFVRPDAEYAKYIDYRVLALLFCLMLVVAGLQNIGVFARLGNGLLRFAKSTRALAAILIFLCFFSAMLITNDVALITFVPFAVMMLEMTGQRALMIKVIVLQTIAANLGSMLTPVGNPQNLYLYSTFNIPMGEFLLHMLPLTLLSGVLLVVSIFMMKNEKISISMKNTECISADVNDKNTGSDNYSEINNDNDTLKDNVAHKATVYATNNPHEETTNVYTHTDKHENSNIRKNNILTIIYCLLAVVCLLCVVRVIPYQIMLAITFITVFVVDRRLLARADYFLLLTFVFFFVFIGNMERIPAVSELMSRLIRGRELPIGAAFSQVISNVPAAILLSGFTDNYGQLLYGVNIGGLGTLIASLASVISFRGYSNTEHAEKGRYMLIFTAYNLVFLALLMAAAACISR